MLSYARRSNLKRRMCHVTRELADSREQGECVLRSSTCGRRVEREAESAGRQREVLAAIRDDRIGLPAGCEVTYEKAALVGEGSSASCPGQFPNTWTIRQPSPVEIVCKVSPIPSGYVIQAEGNSGSCPGTFPNTWTIRRV
jgi:hypothetical protein